MGFFKFLLGEEPSIFEKAAFVIKTKGDKGAYGEYLTKYLFGSIRFKGYYKLLTNIYIPYKNATTEIDILLIHEKGIYVLESKNYSGWIFGNEKQVYWTQSLGKNLKERFYNPIMQNRTHIKALSMLLNIDRTTIKSYIIFSERCELKKIPENTTEYTILKREQLLSSLNKELEGKSVIYTHEEIDRIKEQLESYTNVSQEIKDRHIENIASKKQ